MYACVCTSVHVYVCQLVHMWKCVHLFIRDTPLFHTHDYLYHTPSDAYRYGVYVPLFVPLCVPIVLSTMKAIRWLRKSKETQDQSSCQEED